MELYESGSLVSTGLSSQYIEEKMEIKTASRPSEDKQFPIYLKSDKLTNFSRRKFLHEELTISGWGVLFNGVGAGTYECNRFFYPSIVFHPPSTYMIGHVTDFITHKQPDQYWVIFIDAKFEKNRRFLIIPDKDSIFAIFSECNHLGSTVMTLEQSV